MFDLNQELCDEKKKPSEESDQTFDANSLYLTAWILVPEKY